MRKALNYTNIENLISPLITLKHESFCPSDVTVHEILFYDGVFMSLNNPKPTGSCSKWSIELSRSKWQKNWVTYFYKTLL